ncbi:class I SAM-dependent methyltransferase [Roseivivax sp. CAU 1761]
MSARNEAQAAFWNGDPGRRWVTLNDDLETLHGGVSELILEAAAPLSGARILDIGCGTGARTHTARHAAGPGGAALGLDLSEPLLDLARQVAVDTDLDALRFETGDAQTHALPEAGFDRLLSRFGVMFFDDFAAAFANLRRTLAPGGRAVFATWAGPEANPWFRDTKAAAVARLGPGAPGDPDAPGPMALRDPDRVLPLLDAAGFASPEARAAEVTLHHPGGWEAAQRFLPQIGPIAAMLREENGTEADRDAILADMRDRWARYLDAEGLHLPARVMLYTAGA